jgi:hypothetical protein
MASRTALQPNDSTTAHRGNLDSAKAEMDQSPGWQRRPADVAKGLEMARTAVAQHGSAKAAEKALWA